MSRLAATWVVAAAFGLSIGSAHAGPCTSKIAQFEQAVRAPNVSMQKETVPDACGRWPPLSECTICSDPAQACLFLPVHRGGG
jgi:hypothetical protein